ncbi:hypothetical protein C8Q77DRAFT_261176 [Trametes polyzona]|nr:hypothetical protein C8Q77DRAFT_261176 [Trametes polyzona]
MNTTRSSPDLTDVMNRTYAIPGEVVVGTDMAAVLQDGQILEVECAEEGFEDLLRCANRIKILHLCPPFAEDDVRPFQSILDRPLPALEQLRLTGSLSANHIDHNPASRAPPTFHLRSRNLPRLCHLVLQDTFVEAEPAVWSSLRCIQFRLRLDAPCRFPLAKFLDGMRSAVRLEQVEVEAYLDGPESRAQPPLRIVSLADHRSLWRLCLSDHPAVMTELMSHLVIPAHVVELDVEGFYTGALDPIHILARLLPRSKDAIAVLREPTAVTVNVGSQVLDNFFQISNNSGQQAMNLRILHCLGISAGALFKQMVNALAFLRGAPITKVDLEGVMAVMTKEEWAMGLSYHPSVRLLILTDVFGAPDNSFLTVLSALATRPAGPQGPLLCPNLEEVELDGTCNRPRLLEAVDLCLQQRAQAGAPKLRRLSLKLRTENAQWARGGSAAQLARSLQSRVTRFCWNVEVVAPSPQPARGF